MTQARRLSCSARRAGQRCRATPRQLYWEVQVERRGSQSMPWSMDWDENLYLSIYLYLSLSIISMHPVREATPRLTVR